MDLRPEPVERGDRWALLGVAVALLVAAGVALARELSPPWRNEQERARDLVAARLGAARAARLPHGFRQVWIPELSRVDRCTLCHVALEEGPDLLGLPPPAGSHPHPELFASHPVERFGCTLCHGGQGQATEQDAAHGEVEHWDEPLLTQARARSHGLTRAELMEMRCNLCHRHQDEVAGMPLLNAAKQLFRDKKCTGCHGLEGAGGTAGPDLTYAGDVAPDHLVFPAGWTGPRTALAWHAAHIRQPVALVPDSEMRNYGFDARVSASLALLVRSWRRPGLPPGWLAGKR